MTSFRHLSKRNEISSLHKLPSPCNPMKCLREGTAEFFGTFLMLFIGTAVNAMFGTTAAQKDVWQRAIVRGLAVALSILLVGPISGAHLNPAVTLCLVVFRSKDFKLQILFLYVSAQVLGAFCASLIVYWIWRLPIAHFEVANNITRGLAGSEQSAMMFVNYFPNPGMWKILPKGSISAGQAFGIEVIGTSLVMLIILTFTDFPKVSYQKVIVKGITPYWYVILHLLSVCSWFYFKLIFTRIGSIVACNVLLFDSLTMASFNPAIDFSPRLVALIFGWGNIAFPGPQNGLFWVYLTAPCIGALLAGIMHKLIIKRKSK